MAITSKNKRYLDFTPMLFHIFNNECSHVYCSDRLQHNADGTFDISAYHSDYKTLEPRKYTIHYDQKKHRFYVNRYIRFRYFKNEILNNKLFFISPLLWKDPYETVFFENNMQIGNDKYNVWCICTTYESVFNEESAWKRSGVGLDICNTDDKIVRVSYHFDKFCELLEQISGFYQNKVEFYISIIDYSQSKDTLIKKNVSQIKSLDEYLNLLSLKRKAFFYEYEMRIFAVVKDKDFYNNNDKNSTRNCEDKVNELFEAELGNNSPLKLSDAVFSVTMPPLEPFKRTDVRFEIYDKLQDLDNLDLRVQLKKLFSTPRIVQQSRLYTSNQDSSWVGKIMKNYKQHGEVKI